MQARAAVDAVARTARGVIASGRLLRLADARGQALAPAASRTKDRSQSLAGFGGQSHGGRREARRRERGIGQPSSVWSNLQRLLRQPCLEGMYAAAILQKHVSLHRFGYSSSSTRCLWAASDALIVASDVILLRHLL